MLASLILVISATWLPWATYRSAALVMTVEAGRLGLVLVVCGAGSLGLVAGPLLWNRAHAYWLQLVLGCTALICSLVIALSSIADANRTADVRAGYSTTSYAIGAGLAITASVVLVVTSVTQLRSRTVPKQSNGRTSEPASIS